MPEKPNDLSEPGSANNDRYRPTMTGDYSRISDTAREVEIRVWPAIAAYLDTIREALAKSPPNQPFVIADFGAADGVNSSRLFADIVNYVRRVSPDRPVRLVYIDLAAPGAFEQFWNSSPLARITGVNGSYLQRSFYADLPEISGSLNIAFSSTALHWLDTTNVERDFFRHPRVIQPNQLPEAERAVFRAKWQLDWRVFLAARAREMQSGGLLIMANLADLGSDDWPASAGYNHLRDICAELYREGLITEQELAAVFIPDYFATPGEMRALIEEPAIARHYSLAGVRPLTVPCAYYSQAGDRLGDNDARRGLADALARVVRAWSESSLKVGFSAAHKDLVQAVYQRLADKFYRNPAALPYQYCLLELYKK